MSDYVVQDPEYYGEIYADPFVFDRVYTMDMAIHVTEDGGKTLPAAGWRVHCRQPRADLRPDGSEPPDRRQRRRARTSPTTTAAPGGTSTTSR